MGSNPPQIPKTWIETPLIHSAALSREAGCNIYLKLENLQPSSSFKSRGIGHLMSLASSPSSSQHFYCSSGGNAGLACATAAIALHARATIVVPTSISSLMVEKLRTLGAEVEIHGEHWTETDAFMREVLMKGDEGAVYVPPFDHEDVWAGHGTLVDELETQIERYDGLVCSVGGGGLLIGIMDALQKNGRENVRVLAMETEGADSLAHSLREGKLARLGGITSIATSLGATQVAEKAFEWGRKEQVRSLVLSDAEAAMATVCFADDERILVEPACGVSIAPCYNEGLKEVMFPELTEEDFGKMNVVIVVCGGSKATLSILEEYRRTYGDDESVKGKWHRRRIAAEKVAAEKIKVV